MRVGVNGYEFDLSTPEIKLALEVAKELQRATSMFGPQRSPHEALGVIREEYIEYEKEVFAYNLRKGRDTRPAQRAELIQLAAMAMRAILDTIDNQKDFHTDHLPEGSH